jgi:uncharacterized membrane protein
MKEVMLSVHFIGLALTFGASLAFMFLRIASSKMEKKEADSFKLKLLVLNKMSYMGLIVMVLSGGYLMTPYWKVMADMPLLISKLSLVLFLIVQIVLIHVYAKKTKTGNAAIGLKKTDFLDKISLITILLIVILAVSVFH